MKRKSAVNAQTLGVFALILMASMVIAIIAMNVSNKTSMDIRSRAAQSKKSKDSDALFDASEKDIEELDLDPVLTDTSEEGLDNAELKELESL